MSEVPLKQLITRQCLAGVLSVGTLLAFVQAHANPSGGEVVGGSVTIEQSGTTTTVYQSTSSAIINWQDFSIDENELTQFIQPSSTSVVLNRVLGNDVSRIMGTLKANGQVFIINGNGILFGPNARVDVGGLVASTGKITNEDFLAGRYEFYDAPAGSTVVNQGLITIHDAGMAALVAPVVENSGVIDAQLGKVVLASGTKFTIDLYGDDLITFDAQALVDSGLVENLGQIKANGGHVLLTAAAADTFLENMINMSGYIEAASVSSQNGVVALIGADNTHIQVAGTINVSGDDAGEVGGVVQATATYIELLNGASIIASGDAGGGTVHVGSDQYHNPNDDPNLNTFGLPTQLATAQYLWMHDGATINADAVIQGKGGDVVLWSDHNTWFNGDIYARGGQLSGDGGRIETSGHDYLDVSGGFVTAKAFNGAAGQWLLDPSDVQITASTTSNGGFSGGSFTPTAASSQVSAATIVSILEGGTDVHITTNSDSGGTGNITFATGADIIATIASPGSVGLSMYGFNSISVTEDIIGQFGFDMSVGDASKLITATGAIEVYSFNIGSGTFTQNSATLPSFKVTTFFNAGDNFTRFAGGAGTSLSPYIVEDFYGLYGVRNNLSAYYKLGSNVVGELAGTVSVSTWNMGNGFEPIGSSSTPFTGQLDFNGYQIEDFYFTTIKGGNYSGLFGVLDSATIINPKFQDVYIYVPSGYFVGTLAGAAQNGTTISITGSAGISDSDGSVDITAFTAVGGLIGTMSNSNVTGGGNFTSTGFAISGEGGLFTSSFYSGTMNLGAISISDISLTSDSSGGFMGSLGSATLIADTITANNISLGGSGAAGLFNSMNEATFEVGTVDINNVNAAAGFIYRLQGTNNITVTSLDVDANSTLTAAGLIFHNYPGSITNFSGSYVNRGNVTANYSYSQHAGGIISYVVAPVNGLVATNYGTLSSTADTISIGGIFGYLSGSQAIVSADSVLTNKGSVSLNTAAVGSIFQNVGGIVGRVSEGAVLNGTLVVGESGGSAITMTAPQTLGGGLGYIAGGVWLSGDIASTNITVHENVSFGTLGSEVKGVGGIVGAIVGGNLTGFSATNWSIPTVSAGSASDVGSVVGGALYGWTGGTYSSLANVSGGNNVGGVVGSLGPLAGDLYGFTFSGFTMTNTHNVTGTNNVGGVIGYVHTNMTFSNTNKFGNKGSVTGTTDVGGVIGELAGTSVLNYAYSNPNTAGTNQVSGTNNVGGIVGLLASTADVTNALSGIKVTGSGADIGGIVGENNGDVSVALAVNTLAGSGSNKGVLIGNNAGTLTDGLYNSSINTGINAIGTGTDSGYTSASTRSAFASQATYANFTFGASAWALSSTGYAAPAWCGTACIIELPAAASSGTGLSGTQSKQVQTVQVNSEKTASSATQTTTQEVIAVAQDSSSLTYDGLIDLVTDVLEAFSVEQGSALSLADVSVMDFDESQFEGMTEEEKQVKVKETVETVVDALIGYYCS